VLTVEVTELIPYTDVDAVAVLLCQLGPGLGLVNRRQPVLAGAAHHQRRPAAAAVDAGGRVGGRIRGALGAVALCEEVGGCGGSVLLGAPGDERDGVAGCAQRLVWFGLVWFGWGW